MSNKSDFYAMLRGTKTVTQMHMKKFVQTHPGVLWRHAGKDNFQVKFRHTEQWLDVASFCDNYASRLIHNLETAINDVRKVLDEKEILNKLIVQPYSPEELIEIGILDGGKVVPRERFAQQHQALLEKEDLLQQLEDDLSVIQKDRDEAVKWANSRLERMRAATKIVKESIEFDGIVDQTTREAFNTLWGKDVL
jgi:hypothetical protein